MNEFDPTGTGSPPPLDPPSKKFALRGLWGWIGLGTAIGAVILTAYCALLFRDLEALMGQALESRPSIIFSDTFILKKDDSLADSFLTERLAELQMLPSVSPTKIHWVGRNFDYPEAILPSDSPMRTQPGQNVDVEISEGRVNSISIEGKSVDAVALEPTPVAQLAGSKHTIRDYVKLNDIPTQLLQAIIAIEDQRFLEHIGFDIRSLARAVWTNIRQRALAQGGSTLTQQLVKNLLGTREKTIFRKLRELILAILMEAKYSKDQILEKYLNEVYFGQIGSLEVHGVAEAARYFYNKSIDQLSLAEMALIAGVIRGPAVYSPYKYRTRALDRKDVVLKKMADLQLITPQELEASLHENLNFAPPSVKSNKAPYFVDYVKAQVLDQLHDRVSAEDLSTQGLRIFTTLDLPLQRRADKAVETTVKDLEARYKIQRPLRLEGLLVAADPATGFIRALVGGRSYGETTFNRVLNMKRQVGSTFKPIAYLAALIKGKDSSGKPYSGAYMVEDAPWTYEYGAGKKWSPRNYEKEYRGTITLREAFANSINIPMAKVGVDIGLDRVVEVAHKLGITSELPAVPSLSLGAIDLSAIELLQAYSTIANRGVRTDLTTVRAIVDMHGAGLARYVPQTNQMFEAAQIDVLTSLLSSVVKEGTAKSLTLHGYNKPAYGKTGTTSFYRDAWFAGFSQGLAAVSWAGFDELKIPDTEATTPENEEAVKNFVSPANLTGAGAALPSWARFFVAAKPGKEVRPDPEMDSSIERAKIDRTTGLKAKSSCPEDKVYEEVFLPGTMPTAECGAH